jgi:cell division ATPase FtsA
VKPEQKARLLDEIIAAKHRLSTEDKTSIDIPFFGGNQNLQLDLTRAELEKMAHPVVEQTRAHCLRALADARLSAQDLDEVILVGGVTRMPMVRRLVTEIFGRAPNISQNPDEAVAIGATIQVKSASMRVVGTLASKGQTPYGTDQDDLVMIPFCDEHVYNECPSYGEVIVPADSTTGTHSAEGIFIAWGRGIDNGASFAAQLNLRDVGPTALASLGCPLTTDMDGRALMEVFSESAEPQRQGSSYKNTAVTIGASVQSVYNAGEEAEIRERLKALGYIE